MNFARYHRFRNRKNNNKWMNRQSLHWNWWCYRVGFKSDFILFHSAAVASISPNCKHHFLEFVIFSNWGSIFNTYMISPHYHLFPYSSQHQYQKKFTNFTSQNDSHSDIFLVSKYTKPPIYLLMIATRRHVQKLIRYTFYS